MGSDRVESPLLTELILHHDGLPMLNSKIDLFSGVERSVSGRPHQGEPGPKQPAPHAAQREAGNHMELFDSIGADMSSIRTDATSGPWICHELPDGMIVSTNLRIHDRRQRAKDLFTKLIRIRGWLGRPRARRMRLAWVWPGQAARKQQTERSRQATSTESANHLRATANAARLPWPATPGQQEAPAPLSRHRA